MPAPRFLLWIALAVFISSSISSRAYMVGPAVPLDELVGRADFIFKGTVVSESPSDAAGFPSIPGFTPLETRFHIVSVIKGDFKGDSVSFRHYDSTPRGDGWMYQPQYYHFTPGQPYLVFASRLPADPKGVYRQIWMSHTGLPDEGALLCADDQPVAGKSIQAIFWSELTGLLHSSQPQTVVYAIQLLDRFSGSKVAAFGSLTEFPRDEVVAALKEFPNNPNPDIAQAALLVMGFQNPYMTEERTPYWLSTVGSADTPGLAKMDPQMKNASATQYAGNLISLADSQAADSTRAFSILSLGLTRDPALKAPLLRWLADPAPAVRAAATTLLADFPDLATADRFGALAADPSSQVRAAVARAIGFGQYEAEADLLSALLADQDSKVRRFAAMSLLSFSPHKGNLARIFQSQLDKPEFAPLFLLALARDQPGPYYDALAEVIVKKTNPTNWGGGEIPAFTAWKLLFHYLKTLPQPDLHTVQFAHYLDALEQVGDYSSSEPRAIYAFYLQKGFPDRAKKYRAQATAKATYDLNYYFNQADANPSLYLED